MMRFKMKSDTIQFWILLSGALSTAGAAYAWAQSHIATASSVEEVSRRLDSKVEEVSKRLDSEVEERRELKTEVDGIYMTMIPKAQQIKIRHPGSSE